MLVGLVWLLVAIVAGAIGATQRLQPPGPQILVLALTGALVLGGWAVASFRRWLMDLDWRVIVGLHLSRFVGVDFLWQYRRGELPYAFAVPGGIGDVVIALLACGVLASGRTVARRPHLLLAWNALGCADILYVVLTAARLALAEPRSMAALQRLPLSVLPTFLVPLIIASHILLFARLRRWRRAP